VKSKVSTGECSWGFKAEKNPLLYLNQKLSSLKGKDEPLILVVRTDAIFGPKWETQMTIVEMARAHVNNVANQLGTMINQRDKLQEEILQVEAFLRSADEQVKQAETIAATDGNDGREVSSKDVNNTDEGDQE